MSETSETFQRSRKLLVLERIVMAARDCPVNYADLVRIAVQIGKYHKVTIEEVKNILDQSLCETVLGKD